MLVEVLTILHGVADWNQGWSRIAVQYSTVQYSTVQYSTHRAATAYGLRYLLFLFPKPSSIW